jgi:hypothetical protein
MRAGTINYTAVLKAVKEIIEMERIMECLRIRPERRTEISGLAADLNEAIPLIKLPTEQRIEQTTRLT